jgi:hypothetical protein
LLTHYKNHSKKQQNLPRSALRQRALIQAALVVQAGDVVELLAARVQEGLAASMLISSSVSRQSPVKPGHTTSTRACPPGASATSVGSV